MDPWYDSFVWPYAPFLLCVQVATIFVKSNPWWRLATSLGCTALISAMLAYVSSLPTKYGEGVDLGSPIIAFWLAVSIILFIVLFGVIAARGQLDRRNT
jgi:hypothetical protein